MQGCCALHFFCLFTSILRRCLRRISLPQQLSQILLRSRENVHPGIPATHVLRRARISNPFRTHFYAECSFGLKRQCPLPRNPFSCSLLFVAHATFSNRKDLPSLKGNRVKSPSCQRSRSCSPPFFLMVICFFSIPFFSSPPNSIYIRGSQS